MVEPELEKMIGSGVVKADVDFVSGSCQSGPRSVLMRLFKALHFCVLQRNDCQNDYSHFHSDSLDFPVSVVFGQSQTCAGICSVMPRQGATI